MRAVIAVLFLFLCWTACAEEPKPVLAEADFARCDEILKEEKNGQADPNVTLARHMADLILRLTADPETWSDEEFAARLTQESRLAAIFKKAKPGSISSVCPLCTGSKYTITIGQNRLNLWYVWPAYAANAKTPKDLTRRMLALPTLYTQYKVNLDHPSASENIRFALHAYLDAHAADFADNAAKMKFCEELKRSGVTPAPVTEYEKDMLGNAPAAGPAKAQDQGAISAATKAAIPTEEGYATISKSIAKSKLGKNNSGPEEMNDALERLGAEPETWNDADFKARFTAGVRIMSMYFPSAPNMVVAGWPKYVASAETPEAMVARIKGTSGLLSANKVNPSWLDNLTAQAVDGWMDKHPDRFKTVDEKKKWIAWLKAQGLSANGLATVLKTLE